MESPTISIIVVNYNGKEYLQACINSILNSTYERFEVIVVDNASTDGSFEYLNNNYSMEPRLKIVRLDRNYGFALGNNIGYKHTDPDSRFVFFLNNDTEVGRDCLEKIVNHMVLDSSIGAAQPKIMSMSDKRKIYAVGGVIDFYGRTWHLGSNEYDHGQYDSVNEIFWAQGAAIVVRKDAVRKVGLFDPEYFMYYEETDLCWRMWLAGYRVVAIPEAVVYHYGGATVAKIPSLEKIYMMFFRRRNHITSMLKNYSLPNILRYTLPFLARMMLISVKWSFSGEKVKVKAYRDALCYVLSHISSITRKRMFVQRTRKISDREVMKRMRPTCGLS